MMGNTKSSNVCSYSDIATNHEHCLAGKLLGLLMLLMIVGVNNIAFAYPNEPDGYQGYKWGSTREEIKDKLSQVYGGMGSIAAGTVFGCPALFYALPTTKLPIIVYASPYKRNPENGISEQKSWIFYEKRLVAGYLDFTFPDEETFAKFGNAIIEKYGNPTTHITKSLEIMGGNEVIQLTFVGAKTNITAFSYYELLGTHHWAIGYATPTFIDIENLCKKTKEKREAGPSKDQF